MSTVGTGHRDVFVMSGGAARGAVQVGMMQALLGHGIVPDAFVGTSVGALNAAFMAGDPSPGRVEHLRERWLGLTTRDVFPGGALTRLSHLARHRSSLYPNEGLARLINRWAPASRLENLPVPVRVTTTELATGRAVYHDRGNLSRILLATSALPAIFAPVWLADLTTGGGGQHVDGGLADLVPVTGAVDLAPTRLFVLDASAPPRTSGPRTPMVALASSFGVAPRVRPQPDLGPAVEMHHFRTPDLGIRLHDFSRTSDHIELGRQVAEQVLAGRLAAA